MIPIFGFCFPIGVELQGEKMDLVRYEQSAIFFDMNDDGFRENTAWVGPKSALLVYDYNKSGKIDESKKLVITKWDTAAKTDLEALKSKFDSNRDNVFDEKDSEFNNFYLWQDFNQYGVSQLNELKTLKNGGLKAIELTFQKPDDRLLHAEFGVQNLAKIKWIGGRETLAYDLAFLTSAVGVKFDEGNGNFVIKYANNESRKIYQNDHLDQAIKLNLPVNDHDIILGSTQNDEIIVGDISVVIETGLGDDIIITGNGNNWVNGGSGKNIIKTGSGHDILFINSEDVVDAGEGFDVAFVTTATSVNLDMAKARLEAVFGNIGNDMITASKVQDKDGVRIDGGAGNDVITGSDGGSDLLIGGAGNDKIYGGKGDDIIFIDHEDNLANIDAGEGNDSIYVTDSIGITIDLKKIHAENFFGGDGDDKVRAADGVNSVLLGGAGNDELIGGSNKNYFDGGPGNDVLRGGSGTNHYMFYPNFGHDILYPAGKDRGTNKDYILISSQIGLKELLLERIDNNLIMSLQSDGSSLKIINWFSGTQYQVEEFIYAADSDHPKNMLILGAFADYYTAPQLDGAIIIQVHNSLQDPNGYTNIESSEGDDFISMNGLKTQNFASAIKGNGGADVIYGGAESNVIRVYDKIDLKTRIFEQTGPERGVQFYGGKGNDRLYGAGANDLLDGGLGDDTIWGFNGNDEIYTGSGSDAVFAGNGNDTIIVNGFGIKYLFGQQGSDKFIILPVFVIEKEVCLYTVGGFDINDPKEIIDFTAFKNLHSLADFRLKDKIVMINSPLPPLSYTVLKINDEAIPVHNGNAAYLCWPTANNTTEGCVILTDIAVIQILSHPEHFIFA